ncbi:hypothetical protein IFM89_038386 [Coptis chinensis]|uniref:Phytocyanin domain-containing protein n=1 Tax=Coptis chinensis TaxID=261450 RepID=A0A835H1X7_9MAGN|nr:hypothetical protein IFM89_038386 [Coptis chinensis]
MVLFLVMASLHVSMATVYKVGDANGWTIPVVDYYKKWAADKTFKVGDVIVFEYNNQHNVLEVNQNDYDTCNVTAALQTYESGNDSITLSRSGYFYYLCGIPGHCLAGQKVDIRVVDDSSNAPSPPPRPAPVPSSPTKSNGASASSKGVLGAVFGLAVLAVAH